MGSRKCRFRQVSKTFICACSRCEAQKLIELKQKLTYFLISANALTIAFVVNFLAAHLEQWAAKRPALNVIGDFLVGYRLLGAGACCFSSLGHISYARHLRYRTCEGMERPHSLEQVSWTSEHMGEGHAHVAFWPVYSSVASSRILCCVLKCIGELIQRLERSVHHYEWP